jgi:predicted ATP-dependent serine protease
MAVRFVATPEIPTTGIPELMANILSALKENVELLTATRGEPNSESRVVARGDITASQLDTQSLVSVQNVSPPGFTGPHVDANQIASLAAINGLKNDVQTLANDLAETRIALNLLIRNMTGA